MRIGVPKEVKSGEFRIAMLPSGVEELTKRGHQVLVQSGAGLGSGLNDDDYAVHGAEIVDGPSRIFDEAELIVKVKEPQPEELSKFRPGVVLFTYLHLAASRTLTESLLKSQVTGLAYETIIGRDGGLPCLTPMSEVAGRMSVQVGARFLERAHGGRGILLGGVPGVKPGRVVVLGGGVVGKNAAQIAAGFGARVSILDVNVDRLRALEDSLPSNVVTLFSDRHNVREQLSQADLVIGSVLIPGAKAPKLVTREDLQLMSPGTVIVDVCIDQGGCFETSRPTTHEEPIYEVDGILHYCVPNIPAAVSRTSTYALCNVTFPYIRALAVKGLKDALQTTPGMSSAVNVVGGHVCYEAVARTFDLPLRSFDEVLQSFPRLA